MNLPHGVLEVSLWAGFHDAQIVSMQSSLLERTVTPHLESDHLLEFHKLPLDMQFLLRLEGVQSARVVHYARCGRENSRFPLASLAKRKLT